MKKVWSSIESSNTCESVRDNLRARSKQENTSSWKVSKRLYNPLSSRRLIKSKEIPRTLKDYYMKGGTKYDFLENLLV